MKSYTQLRSLYGKVTKNTNSANLTLGDEMMNDEHRQLCSLKDFSWLRRARTLTTTASTQFKALPYDMEQVESVSVQIGATRYTPKLMHSREEWDLLNINTYTADTPEYAFVYNGQLGLWPIPATSSNTITVNGKIRPVDLGVADYTTGTITTATASDETIVASGSTWTTPMTGRWLRITLDDTADSGDGVWYEISSVTNSTTLELVRKYGGTSIVAGSQAYTIGQMPLLPETFHSTIVWKAAAQYWFVEGSVTKAREFENKWKQDVTTLISQYTSEISDPVLEESASGELNIINPNLVVNL